MNDEPWTYSGLSGGVGGGGGGGGGSKIHI